MADSADFFLNTVEDVNMGISGKRSRHGIHDATSQPSEDVPDLLKQWAKFPCLLLKY